MLPTYGGYGGGYGGRRRGGSSTNKIGLVVLAFCTIIFGGAFWHARSQIATLSRQLKDSKSVLKHSEEQLRHERSLYSHLEYEYRATQRNLHEATRTLHSKEVELDHRTHELAMKQDAEAAADDLREQLNYERAVVEALRQKITQMKTAHDNREADWHELSLKWKEFEEQAVVENSRLLAELAKLGAQTVNATQADIVPLDEPRDRLESLVDVNVELPTQDEFIHHHHDDQQQQQQQGQYNPHNQQWERQGHHREALSTAPGDDHGGQGHDNAAPVSHHAPHDHHFPDAGHWDHRYDNWDHSEHHDLHQWSHYEESIDPLDQTWINDNFDPHHDNFHGEHWEAPPSFREPWHNPYDGHYGYDDSRDWEHHGNNWDHHHHHHDPVPSPHWSDHTGSHSVEHNAPSHHTDNHDSHHQQPSHGHHWSAPPQHGVGQHNHGQQQQQQQIPLPVHDPIPRPTQQPVQQQIPQPTQQPVHQQW